MDNQTREYLVKRQIALLGDQHSFEQMQAAQGTDEQSILYSADELTRLVHETKARRAELALMMTCDQVETENRKMTERDEIQRQLDQAEDICRQVNGSVPLGQAAREARDNLTAKLADLNNR